MAEEVGWDEALKSDGFISLDADKDKILVLTNFRLEKLEKFGKEQVEFQADVLEEDGEKREECLFTTTSKRLKTKLRTIFEGKKADDKIKISILKVGDKFTTNYSVKLLE